MSPVPKTTSRYVWSAWALSLATIVISVLAWGPSRNWSLLPIKPYAIFPLLGLIAFGLMWAHYINGFFAERADIPHEAYKRYYRITGYVVLACILLHPGLLIYQLQRDGAGLPPESYASYVAPGLTWVVILGTISLLIFIAFEFHRFFGKKSWWRYVADASDFAMLAILYHGYRLGADLQMDGWFKIAWLLYATTLILILIRKYYLRINPSK